MVALITSLSALRLSIMQNRMQAGIKAIVRNVWNAPNILASSLWRLPVVRLAHIAKAVFWRLACGLVAIGWWFLAFVCHVYKLTLTAIELVVAVLWITNAGHGPLSVSIFLRPLSTAILPAISLMVSL